MSFMLFVLSSSIACVQITECELREGSFNSLSFYFEREREFNFSEGGETPLIKLKGPEKYHLSRQYSGILALRRFERTLSYKDRKMIAKPALQEVIPI